MKYVTMHSAQHKPPPRPAYALCIPALLLLYGCPPGGQPKPALPPAGFESTSTTAGGVPTAGGSATTTTGGSTGGEQQTATTGGANATTGGQAPTTTGGLGSTTGGQPPTTTGGLGSTTGAQTTGGGLGTTISGNPAVPAVLLGRFTAAAAPMFAWPASSMATGFYGTSISVSLEETTPQRAFAGEPPSGNFYDVEIDGFPAAPIAAKPGAATYVLAANLTLGDHTAMIRKRTEASIGEARFGGFATDGILTPLYRQLSRRMLIIGDSISAGHGNEGSSATCPFTPATENVSKSYGVVAAEILDADAMVIAASGRGIWRNANGTTADTMPILYQRTLPSRSSSTWAPNAWIPQVVVINLGTNDFALGVPPGDSFEQAYLDLIQTLRQQYPKAHILCALGPMLSDRTPAGQSQLTVAREYLQHVVAHTFDERVHFIEFPEDLTSDMGCNQHPNVAKHTQMASQLAQAISQQLGW